jgi:hypothetical protein
LEKINDRKAAFDRLNQFGMARAGWVISIPGDAIVTIETLPSSDIPNVLRDNGYDLREVEGDHKRIIPAATVETIMQDNKPIRRVAHAGVVPVERWTLPID